MPVLILILVLKVVLTLYMGYGVYAAVDIPAGEKLDEYMGQLIPTRMAQSNDLDDYSFEIIGIGSSTAKDYGNWTRFVNHTCVNFNVTAELSMLGGRRTIVFQTSRNIAAGEELLLNYGTGYFAAGEGEIMCQCADFPGPHLPPTPGGAAPANTRAVKGPPAASTFGMQLRSDVSSRNAWITSTKAWMGQLRPSGSSRWTTLHWRLLEQLIRRRRNRNDWLNKYGYAQLPPSTGDPLVGQSVTKGNSSMRIREWHVDVAKAFLADDVCGITGGQPWGMNELMEKEEGRESTTGSFDDAARNPRPGRPGHPGPPPDATRGVADSPGNGTRGLANPSSDDSKAWPLKYHCL
ncbi:hypothetical protein Daus18300_012863 [Diaporthe australafricana]|uniref:SET domain-containing protein n=1 Tax=Diaporthe australafricana TaxID=127596 RepID=A0ABR3W1C9_9PEZI